MVAAAGQHEQQQFVIAQLEAYHPETHILNQRLKKAVKKQKKAATLREAQQEAQDEAQQDEVPDGCTDYMRTQPIFPDHFP